MRSTSVDRRDSESVRNAGHRAVFKSKVKKKKEVEVEVLQAFHNFISRRSVKAFDTVCSCGRKDEGFKKFQERSVPIIKGSGSWAIFCLVDEISDVCERDSTRRICMINDIVRTCSS